MRSLFRRARGAAESVPTRDAFLEWARARIVPQVAPTLSSRRRAVFGGMFAPLASAWGLPSGLIQGTGLQAFRTERSVVVSCPTGSWTIDANQFPGASLWVREDVEQIEVALRNARLAGIVPSLDFRCVISRAGDVQLRFEHLSTRSFVGNFSRWVSGSPLDGGTEDQRLASPGGRVSIRLQGPVALTSDWGLRVAELRILAAARDITIQSADFQLPLRAEQAEGSITATGSWSAFGEDRVWSLGPLASFHAADQRAPIRCEFGATEPVFSCSTILGAGILQMGPTSALDSVGIRLSNALLTTALRKEGDRLEYRLLAHASDTSGQAHARGVTTFFVGVPNAPMLKLAASERGLEELSFAAVSRGDAVACEGVVCVPRSSMHPVSFQLEMSQAPPPSGSFSLHPRTGQIRRGSQPLQLLLRRRVGQVHLEVELHNVEFAFDLGGALPARLVKIDRAAEARALFLTTPQHVGEKSEVIDSSNESAVPVIASSSLSARGSEASRVAFRLPASLFPYDFSIDALLSWQYFEPILSPESSDEYEAQQPPPKLATVIRLFMMSLVPVRADPQTLSSFRWFARGLTPNLGKANEPWHARLIDKSLRVDPRISSGVRLALAEVEDWAWPHNSRDCATSQRMIWPLSIRDRFELRVLSYLRRFAASPSSTVVSREPQPIFGNTVVISSQGGYFNLEGNWAVDDLGFSLVRYLHTIAQARDVNVTIVREYFLYPYGHRMLLVKQTKRGNRPALRQVDGLPTVAGRLETRFFLVAKDDSLAYPAWVQPMPFRTVTIAPEFLQSPALDFKVGGLCAPDEYCPPEPVARTGGSDWHHQAFWVTVGGTRLNYEFDATDYAGNLRRLKLPVIVIENAADGAACTARQAEIKQLGLPPWASAAQKLQNRFEDSRVAFNGPGGQDGTSDLVRLNVAVATVGRDGDTDLEALRVATTAKWKPAIVRRAAAPLNAEIHPCPWVPTIHWMEGRFVQAVLPNAVYEGDGREDILRWILADPDTGLAHHPEQTGKVWLLQSDPSARFDLLVGDATAARDQAAVFVERGIYAVIDRRPGAPRTRVRTSYAQNTESSGGVVSPDIVLGTASRKYGASALPALWNGGPMLLARSPATQLADFFPTSSKLCGVELLKIIAPLLEGSGREPPIFANVLAEWEDAPDMLVAELDWNIGAEDGRITAFPDANEPNAFFYPKVEGAYCKLRLYASTQISFLGLSPPVVNVGASVTNFTVHIGWGSGAGFNGVRIPIQQISYVSRNGQKPEFSIGLGNIEFIGSALEFIDQIRKKLEDLGRSDTGWRIAFERNGVAIDAPPIMFPNVQLGAFAVENLGIYSGLHVPFFDGGGVTCWFSLARPDLRFRVTAGVYAGGGYALLELDTDHVRRFELCIEFGAAKSLRYGPVQGDVGILGGVIYKSIADTEYKRPNLPPTRQTRVVLEAFVRAFGVFNAWNLISLFMELYVSMTSGQGQGVTGTARFSVSTKVGFVTYRYSASHREQLNKRGGGGSKSLSHPAAFKSLSGGAVGPQSEIHTGEEADTVEAADLLRYLEAFEG